MGVCTYRVNCTVCKLHLKTAVSKNPPRRSKPPFGREMEQGGLLWVPSRVSQHWPSCRGPRLLPCLRCTPWSAQAPSLSDFPALAHLGSPLYISQFFLAQHYGIMGKAVLYPIQVLVQVPALPRGCCSLCRRSERSSWLQAAHFCSELANRRTSPIPYPITLPFK